ncbi:MAG: hypothetical protein O3B95_03510, partial [Chloroflexi bacterium]|nr:hypothetical protein [Chloroflexota bacterium]
MTEENRIDRDPAGDPQAPEGGSADESVEEAVGQVRPSFAFGEEATLRYPEQVRAALDYARRNQYEYGPQLRDLELKWDVLSAEPMSNNIVRIRFEYSPVKSFRGDPGSEYMDIDAGGAVLARRQINAPKENKPVVLIGI